MILPRESTAVALRSKMVNPTPGAVVRPTVIWLGSVSDRPEARVELLTCRRTHRG